MKILTNDYLCNTPDLKKPAKGGPANFARLFFNFLKEDSLRHKWFGIIAASENKKKYSSIKKIASRYAKAEMYEFLIPASSQKLILKAKSAAADPEKIFAEPITRLARLMKNLSPDIVFLNGYAMANWIILKAAGQAGLPVVIQHAGIWHAELDIYKDFFSTAGVKIMKRLEKDSAVLSSAEIFLNDFSRKRFDREVWGGKRHPRRLIKIIPLPVDFNFFKKRSNAGKHFNFDKKIFHIGIVSRWDRIKNHEAIAALAELAKKRGLPWVFHSITSINPSKKKAAFKKKYRENVDIIGHLPKEKIKDFCHENDLIIIPSKFDVSPTILLESLACGTPAAISPNVGFVDDYRRYGAKRWIIDFDNPAKAIRQISNLKKRPLPKKLKKELLKKHEMKKVFKQYLSLFNKLTKIKK